MKTKQTKANKKSPQNRRKSISFAVRLFLASATNTKDASNVEFSISFSLSSLKGVSLPSSSAPKSNQKFIHFRSAGVFG